MQSLGNGFISKVVAVLILDYALITKEKLYPYRTWFIHK
jgi:hypothetical protein